jgi:hypothetical protein
MNVVGNAAAFSTEPSAQVVRRQYSALRAPTHVAVPLYGGVLPTTAKIDAVYIHTLSRISARSSLETSVSGICSSIAHVKRPPSARWKSRLWTINDQLSPRLSLRGAKTRLPQPTRANVLDAGSR